MPTVPISVWDQIPVVVIFAFLLAGLGLLLVRVFSKAVADINQHYEQIIRQNNEQWQKYFDAKDESNRIVSEQVVRKLEDLTKVIQRLVNDFNEHDRHLRSLK